MLTARSTDADAPAASRRLAFTALPYFAAFAIPFCALCAAFALNGIYPFGATSVMLYDMPMQYVDFFGWLSEVLRGNANLLYSNAAGLGGGMFSLFTYYLSSPFNLLAAFWQPEDMPKFFSVLYLLKIPTASITCLLFLRGRFLAPSAMSLHHAQQLCSNAPAHQHLVLTFLACSYALSSYTLGYASNIMWLDGVIMLPLAALGVYRLVQRHASIWLFAACACAAIFNWYTGYMVCLYCVLYFFFELARAQESKGHRLKLCLRFGITMLFAVGASAVILLPTVLSLLGSKGGDLVGLSSFNEAGLLAHSPVAIPSLFTIGTLPGILPRNNMPAVVISAFVLVGVGIFFASRTISRRAKTAGGIFAALMVSSLAFPMWTTVWSGFILESSYTNRNGFAILLTLVFLAAEAFTSLRNLSKRRQCKAALIGGIAVTIVFALSECGTYVAKGKFQPSFELAALEIALLLLFTILTFAVVRLSRKNEASSVNTKHNGRTKPHAAAITAACLALTLTFAGEQGYATYLQFTLCCHPVNGFTLDLREEQALYSQLPAINSKAENGTIEFTRIANAAPYWGISKFNGPDNMALLLGYSTFDHYTSTQESRIQKLLAELGYSKMTPAGTYYMSSNVVADALLGVTHIVDDSQPVDATPAGDACVKKAFKLHQNSLALPLGWGTTGTTQVDWESSHPFANQQAMLSDAANRQENVFESALVKEHESGESSRSFAVTCTIDGPMYLYTPTLELPDLYYDGGITSDIYVDGQYIQSTGGRGACNEMYIGYGHAGQTVQVEIKNVTEPTVKMEHKNGTLVTLQNDFWDVSADDLLQVVSVDEGALREQLSRIDSAGFALTAYDNGHIAATFNAAQDETLVISQPYEDGWSATVNGQAAQLEPAYDGLMGVKVSAGENDIELHYLTPGLVPGAVVSIASVTLFAVWRIAARRRSMQKSEKPASA